MITNTSQITEVLRKVQIARHQPYREVFKTKTEGDAVVVSVNFVDVDTSKSRVLQKREKDLEIRISPTDTEINITSTDSSRAKEIVQNVLDALKVANATTDIHETKIDLSPIRDHKLRLKFFIKMMREMPGMVLLDVSNVKVDRVPPIQQDEENESANAEAEKPVQEQLRRAVLMGEQLLITREFQELASRGFFISSANWISEKNDGRGVQVEFSAGFSDSSDAKEFSYKVMGEYSRDDDGVVQAQRKKVFGSDRLAYQDALEKSAFAALSAIKGEANLNVTLS
jgi:hypothetical protein